MRKLKSLLILFTIMLGACTSAPSAETAAPVPVATPITPSIAPSIARRLPPRQLGTPIEVDVKAFDGASEKFLSHANYLAMTLPLSYLEPVRAEVQKRDPKHDVHSRGEAHITVLTPPEFTVLQAKLKMTEIEALARELQKAYVEPACVGSGHAQIKGRDQVTYFVVVRADALIELRREIAKAFVAHGGSAAAFNAEHFYPHITLGFSDGDLFEEQGVIKDEQSCIYRLKFRT